MRSRTDRKQDIDAIKQNLYDAGTSILTVAQTSEDLFTSSVRALTAALDPEPTAAPIQLQPRSIRQLLQDQQREARQIGDVDSYLEATQKLQTLEEFDLGRLERKARRLELEIRIRTSQEQLGQLKSAVVQTIAAVPELPPAPSGWTEADLKSTYKTLQVVRAAYGIAARTWKDAVVQVNQLTKETDEEVTEL
jgi:hypothetical protein